MIFKSALYDGFKIRILNRHGKSLCCLDEKIRIRKLIFKICLKSKIKFKL